MLMPQELIGVAIHFLQFVRFGVDVSAYIPSKAALNGRKVSSERNDEHNCEDLDIHISSVSRDSIVRDSHGHEVPICRKEQLE